MAGEGRKDNGGVDYSFRQEMSLIRVGTFQGWTTILGQVRVRGAMNGDDAW